MRRPRAARWIAPAPEAPGTLPRVQAPRGFASSASGPRLSRPEELQQRIHDADVRPDGDLVDGQTPEQVPSTSRLLRYHDVVAVANASIAGVHVQRNIR